MRYTTPNKRYRQRLAFKRNPLHRSPRSRTKGTPRKAIMQKAQKMQRMQP